MRRLRQCPPIDARLIAAAPGPPFADQIVQVRDRLARRHVGRQAGWIFTFRDLHTRSGSAQPYGQFARDLRKAIARNALPEYSMNEIEGANGPSLAFNRDPAKIEWRQDRRYKL